VSTIQGEGHASVKLADSINAAAGGKYKEQVTGVSKLVGAETEMLLMKFRVIYTTYAGSPCTREDYLTTAVMELIQESWRFQKARLKMDCLIELAKNGAPPVEILALFREIHQDLSQPAILSQLNAEMKEAKKRVAEWRQH